MTDFKKFKELYESIGVEFTEGTNYSGSWIRLSETDDEKIGGYDGYYSLIRFDKEGKFSEQGFWAY